MSGWVAVAAVAGAILVAGLALYWLLVVTEGSYLGARTVALMYNWVAGRYDAIKAFDSGYEELFLLQPLLAALEGQPRPWVLDVATGTGRVPWLLADSGLFRGRVIGLDFARRMLRIAAGRGGRVGEARDRRGGDRPILIWQNAMRLPFTDGSFELVSCLEALEFMPQPDRVLAELVRVTRPGGMLALTRRRGWERRFMPGKGWTREAMLARLYHLGVDSSRVQPWQKDYDLVWGRKGTGQPSAIAGFSPQPEIDELLCCPVCAAKPLAAEVGGLRCGSCGRSFPVADDGVLELARDV